MSSLSLQLKIISFTDAHQPGFVRCSFKDASGTEWFIEDKVPVVSLEDLDANSSYPKDGSIGCMIIDEQADKTNKEIVTIKIDEPLWISSPNEELIFNVFKSQLSSTLS